MKLRDNHLLWCQLVPLLAVVLPAGCSGAKTPATSTVKGTVTYNGAPVDGATVVFAPTSTGKPATAVTDSSGHYELSTFGSKDGASPGDYTVTVTKTATEGAESNLTPEQMNELALQGKPLPGPTTKQLLPQKYAQAATSDLHFTVKAGANDIPIELKD
jgi:hypothetical protein